jgi:hypothetical protein
LFVSRTWRFTAFVGAGVEEVFASLRELREGFLPHYAEYARHWKESQVETLIAANIRAAKVQINHPVFDKVVAE